MTSNPGWAAVPPEQIPPYCRTCRRALQRRLSPGGVLDVIHAAEQRGETSDHPADPAPITEIVDPIIECDFCSAPDATWIYWCADQRTDTQIVTSRTVALHDYQRRHLAARTRSVETSAGPSQMWGERWSACEGCATLIETRDLLGLIWRVTDAMPAKYTRGKKLLRVRGDLHANYSTVLATLRPGRARITAEHPLGVWEPPDDQQPMPDAAQATDTAGLRPAVEEPTDRRPTMDLNYGARVRQPRDAVEYRLGTVTDIGHTPDGTHVERYRLRFPTGEERTYPAAEVIAASGTDDHAALVAAFTDTCRSLRDACRIAHDFDEQLSGDIIGLLLAIYGTVSTRLGVAFDPTLLDAPVTAEGDGDQR
jgi:hypothetical protein